jgi:hypothetical protein
VNRARIVLLCVGAAITYGVLHDQVTARLCIEYFTVAHPPLLSATSPTMVALCWGVAATAGIGTVLGVLLALVAHAGSQPPVAASRLFRPVLKLLMAMAISAVFAGTCGFFLAQHETISIPDALRNAIPPSRHHVFMAVWFAHAASYLVGLGGGALLVFRVWRVRGRPGVLSIFPRSPIAILRATVIITVAAYVLWIRFGAH